MADLSPTDDDFHPPLSDDPFWTETAWFGFSIPERRLAGAVYPLFRANQGVCAAGVHVWDDTAETPYEVLYSRTWWHLPMPGHSLTQLRLPCGLEYDSIEPLQTYRVRYRDGDELALDVEFDAVHAIHAPTAGDHGHFDQAGHVTGELRLGGETLAIDCHDMRDRSWSVRRDTGPVRAGYDYAVGDTNSGFLAMTMFGGDHDMVLAGYHVVDGGAVRLTGGTRTVERKAGRPIRVRIEASDEAGGQLEAEGECVNRFAFQSSPNYFAWMSLTRWSFDGTEAWGENQDVWSPALLRAELAGGSHA